MRGPAHALATYSQASRYVLRVRYGWVSGKVQPIPTHTTLADVSGGAMWSRRQTRAGIQRDIISAAGRLLYRIFLTRVQRPRIVGTRFAGQSPSEQRLPEERMLTMSIHR